MTHVDTARQVGGHNELDSTGRLTGHPDSESITFVPPRGHTESDAGRTSAGETIPPRIFGGGGFTVMATLS